MAFDAQMGIGGGNVLTAINESEGIKAIMNAITTDLNAANVEGGWAIGLRVTAARLGEDYGWGGKGVMPSGSAEHLRAILDDVADDIEEIRVAGTTFVRQHTKAKMPVDFLSGGKHLHRGGARDDGGAPSPGVGPDGLYDWILHPLNAVAVDIASIKSVNGLSFTPETVPIT